MNNDLIPRIAVCDMLHEEMGAWGNCADEIEALLKANDALWKIPAVDAVEVVRCRECVCCEKERTTMGHVLFCRHWVRNTTEDGYCHEGWKMDGERKGDGNVGV